MFVFYTFKFHNFIFYTVPFLYIRFSYSYFCIQLILYNLKVLTTAQQLLLTNISKTVHKDSTYQSLMQK